MCDEAGLFPKIVFYDSSYSYKGSFEVTNMLEFCGLPTTLSRVTCLATP